MPSPIVIAPSSLQAQTGGRLNLVLPSTSDTPGHPKVVFRAQTGAALTLPLGPTGGRLGGWVRRWNTVDRWGKKPILDDGGPSLRTAAYTIDVLSPDGSNVSAILERIRAFAEKPLGAITVQGLDSVMENGTYRMTQCDAEIVKREHGTNSTKIVKVDVAFTELAKAKLRIARSARVAT